MKAIKTSLRLLALAVILISTSCTKDENPTGKDTFNNGIFIVNEGVYNNGTGTITYFSSEDDLIKQDIFEMVNGRPLGNIAQNMTIFNGKGYIVVNNAGTVEVVDIEAFTSIATITNLVNPSHFLAIDSTKGYISDWAGNVAVVNLNTNTVSYTIPAGTGPSAMIKSGKFVYVANEGGLSVDSIVTVIDFTADTVVKTIYVGDVPTGMAVDGNGRVWVMCKGIGFAGYPAAGDTPGRLIRINPETLAVDYTYKFSSVADHPEKLVINKQKSMLYFLYNSCIYKFNITSGNSTPEKLVSRYFYSIGYENKTGYLYASDPKDFASNGIVLRINANDGSVIDSIQSGITPRAFAFPE